MNSRDEFEALVEGADPMVKDMLSRVWDAAWDAAWQAARVGMVQKEEIPKAFQEGFRSDPDFDLGWDDSNA